MLINDASITGSLIVNASASFQNISVGGNIIPDETNIRNLGSTDKYFKEIYVSTGSINFVDGGSVVAVLSAGTITAIQSNTSSANSRLNSIESVSASLQSFTASISTTNTFTSSATARLNALETTSASIDTLNSTQNNRLGSLETISASNISRISALETTSASVDTLNSTQNARLSALETTSASVDTLNTTQNTRLTNLEIKTGSLATTGSNTFIGTQTITGSLFISANLVVQGTSSLENITASAVSIGTNIVNLNTANPAIRYAGLVIGDSGSIGSSGSFLYDSVQDEMIFVHRGANTTVTSSVVLMGPQTFDSIGSETYPTLNIIQKGTGNEHLGDSCIFDNGTTTCVKNNLIVTGTSLLGNGSAYSNGTTIKGASNDYSLTILQSNVNNAGWGVVADTSGNLSVSRYSGGAYTTCTLNIALNGVSCFANTICSAGAIVASSTACFGSTIFTADSLLIGTTSTATGAKVYACNNAAVIFRAESTEDQAGLRLIAGCTSVNRASRIDFLNGATSRTTPQWTIINDYNQNGTNDLSIVSCDPAVRPFKMFQSGIACFSCQICAPSFIGGTLSGTSATITNSGTACTITDILTLANAQSGGSSVCAGAGILFTGNAGATVARIYSRGNMNFNNGSDLVFQTQVSAGGTPQCTMVINGGSQSVGIGTFNPVRKLDIVTTSEQLRLAYDTSGTVFSDFRNDSAGGLLINTSNSYIINYIGGTERIRISDNCSVTLRGSLGICNGGAINMTIPNGSNGGSIRMVCCTGANEGDMYFTGGGGVGILLAGSGRVGIGTTIPSAPLSIRCDSSSGAAFMEIATCTSNAYRYVSINSGTGISYCIPGGTSQSPFIEVQGGAPEAGGGSLRIRTGAMGSVSDRMIITQGGIVGINTTDPKANLHVCGSTATFRVGPWFSSDDRDFIQLEANGTDTRILSPNERFKIENTSGCIQIVSGGSGGVQLTPGATSWASMSDIRKKKNFEPTQGLDELLQIEPVKYHFEWDDNCLPKRLGFIAQNIKPLIPEMVKELSEAVESCNTYLTITPDYLLPVLVKSIQEQQCTICSQALIINTLKTCLGII